jgi:hypothetical protein
MGAVDVFLEQLRRRAVTCEELARLNADPWRDLCAEDFPISFETDRRSRAVAQRRCLQEIAEAWRDFGQLPGTRLSCVRTGIGRRELRTAEQQTVASGRDSLLVRRTTLSAGGKTFTQKWVDEFSWPGIAKTISSYRPGEPAHMRPDGQANKMDTWLRQLLNETGTPILYTAGITSGQAGGYIKFPGHRWLRFPVQGTNLDSRE